MPKIVMLRTTLLAVACALFFSGHALADGPRKVDVPAGELIGALRQLAEQSGVEFVYSVDELKGVRTRGVRGEYKADAAVMKLLEGTKLTLTAHESGALLIASPAAPSSSDRAAPSGVDSGASVTRYSPSVAPVGSGASQLNERASSRESSAPVPEILVRGARTLNMDIARSRDDAQPYVVFDRSAIERSGATNLDEFLKQRLTMNTVGASSAQQNSQVGSVSTINLRGLGPNQTLILIDGRRPAPINASSGSVRQADLNGIPLAAIERIEVLPSTASGIYGGGATGGVVNVVLRRDYVGVEAKVKYENTFTSDVTMRSVDLASGFSLADGRTSVLLAASFSDNNMLLLRERSLFEEGRAAILANSAGNYEALNIADVVPPGGATPNIRSLDGSSLRLRNGTTLGSPITFVPAGYGGASSDGGAALIANAGEYNLEPAGSAQNGFGGLQSLLGQPVRKSAMATVRHRFTPRFEAFLDVAASDAETSYRANYLRQDYVLPAAAATNPFAQDVVLSLPLAYDHPEQRSDLEDLRAVGGLMFQLPGDWMAEADYTWSRSRSSFQAPGARLPTLAADIRNGAIDVLKDLEAFPINVASYVGPDQSITPQDTVLKDAVLRVAGPIWRMPGGEVVLSSSLSHRDERLSEGVFNNIIPSLSFFFPAQELESDAAYVELMVPFVGPGNARPGLQQLQLQLAGRYDEYTLNSSTGTITVGSNEPIARSSSTKSSTNPTFALRYQPVEDLVLRGSFGSGFLPPTFSQVLSIPTPVAFSIVDPLRGNTRYSVSPGPNSIQGGNPNIEPEASESLSLGFILAPRVLPGLRLSLDWTRIEKTDNIVSLGNQRIVNNETSLPGRVLRGPNLPGDQAGWAGRVTAIDATVVNLAEARVEAFDLALDYTIETASMGRFELYAFGTRQTRLERKILPTDAFVEQVGITSASPLELKANLGLTWTRRNWTLGWSTSYFDSYFVADAAALASAPVFAQQGAEKVESQMYHDVFGVYRTRIANGGSWVTNLLEDTEIQVGVRNVFNEKPPLDVAVTELYSPFGDPRMASYYLMLQRRF